MRQRRSGFFKASGDFIIGDHAVEFFLFPFRSARIMSDDVIAQCGFQHVGIAQGFGGIAQRARDFTGAVVGTAGLVNVTCRRRGQFQTFFDPGKPRSQKIASVGEGYGSDTWYADVADTTWRVGFTPSKTLSDSSS